MDERVLKLMDFIDNSPTSFHAVSQVEKILSAHNFKKLSESDKWDIEKGEKYFVNKDNGAIIAFSIGLGEVENNGFKMIASHVDSPCLKIKPSPDMADENTYLKLNTEVYGSPILSTWFDRPLGIAGRIVLKGDDVFKPEVRIVNIDRAVSIIPNLAIHFTREKNQNEIDKQKELTALLAIINDSLEQDNSLISLLESEFNISRFDILDFELSLYDYSKSEVVGANEEFLSAGRLDDLWMVQSSLMGLLNSKDSESTKVGVFLNHEEIGSKTNEGADSVFLKTILKRICIGLSKTEEDFYRALENSFMISADLAHGVHPNYKEISDPTNRPVLGSGVVLKYSSNKRYLTDSYTSAIIIGLCENNNIPYQKFVNNSNLRGGSTMGTFFSSHLAVRVLDLGSPILSMHSIKELASANDVIQTEELFRVFYEA